MTRNQTYKPGKYTFLLELPAALSLDLHAFCAVHFNAPRNEIVRQALQEFIERELSGSPRDRKRFNEARNELAKEAPANLSVVRERKGQ